MGLAFTIVHGGASLARHYATALVAVFSVMLGAASLAASAQGSKVAADGLKARIAAAAGVAPDCATILVSTVNSNWARIDTAPVNGCPAGNGFIVMHFARGKWRVIDQGSEPFSCALNNIPIKVGRDIHVCNPPKTFVLCRAGGRDFRRTAQKPKRCDTLGPRESFSQAVNLAGLSWQNWGHKEAKASGVDRGYRLPFTNIKVSVRAYRRKLGDCGDYIYTRLNVTSRYGTTIVKFPALCGDSY
jgi:hypothetical protein